MKQSLQLIHEVNLPSTTTSITEVETLIDKACAELNLHEDLYGNILIAVTEAVNNALIHGNKMDASLMIHVGVFDNTEWVCFSVKDQGQGFDPLQIPDPTAPENLMKENGRGVFLMQNLADEMDFEENGTRVNIYFKK
ncbi:MAG: ATP-binding protein [Flavobacteriia bacterium]|jgi:serine/threonine-protein kinase RsbW|nr:ATP-binding protein [Flavobacteriia bacterium]NBV67788.1 ATP-binding protein [Flavobacteriia bacterium]NBY41241.1 ATP-binding protein [Flavobacteriia bacterium]